MLCANAGRILLSVLCILFLAAAPGSGSNPYGHPYLDSEQAVDRRVEDLLARMTLEEKIGQMNMPCVYVNGLGKTEVEKTASVKKFAEGTLVQNIGPSGGYFTLANTILHKGPRQQAEFFNELQKIATEKTRLKIPLFEVEEGTHGLMCSGGTIFPEGMAIGSTWDMNLVQRIYEVAAREGRGVGIHALFTLVVEPTRDPRLGRNEEGYSEDPFLCSRISESIVKATQGSSISAVDKLVAGLCHYPGQGQPVGGHERGAMEISERTLREVFLPPWVAGITKTGALGVMATYPAIDGVPVHKSEKILTKILRDELGFQGLVLSEGSGISTLLYEHVAADAKESGQLSLKAGVDVGISFEDAYMNLLRDSVREGKVPVELIDRAVRRILWLKFRLGLFENPLVDVERAVKVSHTKESQDLALLAAREGIVLLKNERSLLPLKKSIKSIAVIGPNANHERNQLGDYIANTILQKVVTVLEGVKSKVSPETKVEYVKGCEVFKGNLNEIAAAQAAAKRSEVAIVVVGENERRAANQLGTDGEGKDVASLDLTGLQEQLVKAVYQTGTPTIVVLINGRPLTIPWIAENVPAILEAWNCGEKGGEAVADVLFGDWNPSGRLPVTIPRHVGQYPFYYNYMPSRAYWMKSGYVDMSFAPLYEFGYGLSYTKFEYSNLQITPQETGARGDVRVSVDVKNTGGRAGSEVVQLYLNDQVSSVTRPIKELKGFEKISLGSAEKKTVRFKLTPEELSFLDENLVRVVEPGKFNVMVGASSADIRLNGSFTVAK